MPVYKYKGFDKNENIVNSVIKADDLNDLKLYLNDKGITLIEYKCLKEKRRSNFLAVSSKIKKREFLTFCQQFSIMLNTGCSISECLDTLRQQNFGTVFKNTISEVYEDVLKGTLLSDAFKKHKKAFPDFFCSMIYVGELSGSLPVVFDKVSHYYENDAKIKSKTRTALMYPSFLGVVVFIMFFFLMGFVVPMFKESISQYGQELPALTKSVMAVSDFIIKNWLSLLIGIGGTILFFFIYFKTKHGKVTKEAIFIHIPIVKFVKINSLTTRFATALGILIGSGLEVVEAMKEMPNVMGSEYFNKKFKFAVEEINNGKRLSRALENCGIFPPLLIQMVKVGERNSALEQTLTKSGRYYEDELNVSITRATTLLEPLMIVLLGALVAVILLAVFLPIVGIANIGENL